MRETNENNESQNFERRSFTVEIRAEEEGESAVIRGTAAVYNRWSEDLGGFKEMIEPGFFDDVLKGDIRALWNHNTDMVLGRTRAGTLTVEDTERGLDVAIHPPDTQVGRDAVTSITRRDVDQMSFAFRVKPNGDEWSRDKDGTIRRVLKRGGAAALFEVSPVAFPAYQQTSVYVRSQLEQFTRTTLEDGATAERTASARARNANRKRKIQIQTLSLIGGSTK